MPNCFQLRKKGQKEAEFLNQIDKDFCEFFGIEIHKTRYGGGKFNWFDTIGWEIAVNGKHIGTQELRDAMIEGLTDPNEIESSKKVVQWFEDNYESTSWVEIGKR